MADVAQVPVQTTTLTERAFLERVIEERGRFYDERIRAVEAFFAAQIAAMEKSMAAAFAASDKAISKAEQAQADYNIRSNEFRGQLDDQAKTLMPRSESLSLHKNHTDRMDQLRVELDKDFEAIQKQIAELRESRSEGAGRAVLAQEARAQGNWRIGLAVTLGVVIVGWAITFLLFSLRSKP